VEKAYAKAHGSYHAISGGYISEGLLDLTGCPTETIALLGAGSEHYGGETASHTTPFAWCTPFLKDVSRRHSSPALPFQRLTGKTFD
jgi:hypothetical protein